MESGALGKRKVLLFGGRVLKFKSASICRVGKFAEWEFLAGVKAVQGAELVLAKAVVLSSGVGHEDAERGRRVGRLWERQAAIGRIQTIAGISTAGVAVIMALGVDVSGAVGVCLEGANEPADGAAALLGGAGLGVVAYTAGGATSLCVDDDRGCCCY